MSAVLAVGFAAPEARLWVVGATYWTKGSFMDLHDHRGSPEMERWMVVLQWRAAGRRDTQHRMVAATVHPVALF